MRVRRDGDCGRHGAGRGMGREIARRLVARGYAVLVTDIDLESAQETAELLGERAWPMALDVRDPEAHRAVASAAAERGRLAVSSFGPVPGLAVYGATKHAVLGFSGSLQGDLEQAGIDIRVHAVCPDSVDTGMVRERQAEPDAAIIFSAPKLLDPGDVADRVVSLLDSDKIVLAIPRNRACLTRTTAAFPRADLRMLELFRRLGERKRQKAAL